MKYYIEYSPLQEVWSIYRRKKSDIVGNSPVCLAVLKSREMDMVIEKVLKEVHIDIRDGKENEESSKESAVK